MINHKCWNLIFTSIFTFLAMIVTAAAIELATRLPENHTTEDIIKLTAVTLIAAALTSLAVKNACEYLDLSRRRK